MVKLVFLRDEWFGDFGNWLGREKTGSQFRPELTAEGKVKPKSRFFDYYR